MGSTFKGEEEPTTTPGTSVPRHIADRILSSRSSLEGERKQVTVLFADVAGFTPLSERLDPEEVRDLLRPAIDIMASEIHAYEGTIAQFTGDGLMALFGAPLAHEDAPHRAIYAALAMQRRLAAYAEELQPKGIELSIRVGINTGLVIVGRIGDDLSMEYTALGDTVNLASRMESSAKPGTVQIAESTHRLTQGYFDFSDLGEIEVKGREQPIHTYRVLGGLPTRSRISASLSRGLSTFVGRERELDNLVRFYQHVKDGSGQVVGMVGEPGVGKSRLLLQLRELIPQDEYTYLEGGCIHYGEAIAYLPILDILKAHFDIQEGEEESASKEKMGQRLSFLNGQRSHILPSLQELLSMEVDDQTYLSLEPVQRRERVFEAIRYLLMAESEQRPLILAIEDLHWIDKTTEEFLSYFIEGLPAASILLLLLYRPEYTPACASKTFYSQIRVDHLTEQPSTELVEAILSEGEVTPEISDLIVEKTAGNPLFIEELTRGLLEAGSILKDNSRYILSTLPSDIQVPSTIQGIIASRLDRLSDEAKEILQVASVIGREFSLRLLQEVTGLSKPLKSYLLQLQSLEFIYEKSLFPSPEYIFKHALTQEVAYESLLLKRRREIHERIGQAIERLCHDNLEDFYETLAYHYSRSDNTDKALHYLKLSGGKAVRNYSSWEAIGFFREAIRVLDSQPETEEKKKERLALYFSLLDPLIWLSLNEQSLELLQEMEKLSEELGDDASLAAVYSKLSLQHSVRGDMAKGMEYSEKCFNTADRAGDVEAMANTALDISPVMIMMGNFSQIAAIACRALELIEEQHREKDLFAGGVNLFVNQCGFCGNALGILGEFEEGEAIMTKGLACGLDVNDTFGIGWVGVNQAFLSCWKGDADSTIDRASTAIEFFEKSGVDMTLGTAWTFLGAGHFFLGDHETARVHAEKGLETQLRSGFPVLVPVGYLFLAMICAAAGDHDGALESAEAALRMSRDFGAKAYEAWALLVHGRSAAEVDPSRIGAAEESIRQGISLAKELNARPMTVQGYLFLGEVFEIAGRWEEALENLRKAEQMYQELGVGPHSYWLTRTQEALARLEPTS